MIISSPEDFHAVARRKLPRFLFDYIEGGANAELTANRNVSDLQSLVLRQRVLRGSEQIDLKTSILGQSMSSPLVLAPVGLTGM